LFLDQLTSSNTSRETQNCYVEDDAISEPAPKNNAHPNQGKSTADSEEQCSSEGIEEDFPFT
jgi:hypothetical protein